MASVTKRSWSKQFHVGSLCFFLLARTEYLAELVAISLFLETKPGAIGWAGPGHRSSAVFTIVV
jgi:hypothetical protein